MSSNITQFPILTNTISELAEATTLLGTDLLPVVAGGVTKKMTSLNLAKNLGASNIVIVKSQADFPNQDATNIYLDNNTEYLIGAPQLLINKDFVGNVNDMSVKFTGTGIATTQLILNSPTVGFKSGAGVRIKYLYFENLRVSGYTGTKPLFNLQGHPTGSLESEVVASLCQFENFSGVLFKDMTGVFWLGVKHFQVGEIIYDNVLVYNHINFVGRHFVSTGRPFITVKTNIRQANMSSCAFFQAKGESILNVDPAILPTSGLSIGTAVPYQGDVFAGIIQFANIGGGQVRVVVAGGHSFSNGNVVNISSTTSYNGNYTISNVLNVDPTFQFGTFDITAIFVADDAKGVAVLLNGSVLYQDPFFWQDIKGVITNIANNGSGNVRITSAAHGLTTGKSLKIKNTNNYDQGGYASVINANTFDLLNVFGVPVPFTVGETSGNWDSSSLDQTDNVISVTNAGGIVSDSQALIDASNSTLLAFSGSTTFTRVIWSTGWVNNTSERFTIDSTGVITFRGKKQTKCYVNLELNCAKLGGGTIEVRMNPMYRPLGGTFTELARPRAIQTGSSANMQVVKSGIILILNPGDSVAFGVALDTTATLNINSALIQLGIA